MKILLLVILILILILCVVKKIRILIDVKTIKSLKKGEPVEKLNKTVILSPMVMKINEETKIYVFMFTKWIGIFFGGSSIVAIYITVKNNIIEYVSVQNKNMK